MVFLEPSVGAFVVLTGHCESGAFHRPDALRPEWLDVSIVYLGLGISGPLKSLLTRYKRLGEGAVSFAVNTDPIDLAALLN